MKNLTIPFLFMLCLINAVCYSQPYTNSTVKTVNLFSSELAKLSVAERKEMLEQQHKLVYELPYTEDFIFNHIFPELHKHRPHLAPHFPVRSASIETDKINMEKWLKEYPDELAAYLLYVSEKIQSYQELKQ
jgi:hypothetical protein